MAAKCGRNLWLPSAGEIGGCRATYLYIRTIPVWVDPRYSVSMVPISYVYIHTCMWVDPRHSVQMAPISYVYVPYMYVS